MLSSVGKLDSKLWILPLVFSTIALVIGINKPFIGHHDFMSGMEGVIAKNYYKYGVINLKFAQITGDYNGELKSLSLQTTYLPLLPLLINVSFHIFGIHEWTERIVPAIFSILGVLFFFLICQKYWGRKTAFVSSFFYIFNPMFLYFGKLPAPEPVIVGLSMASIYFYLLWFEKKTKLHFAFLCALIFIGGLVGWPIIYLCPLFILHSIYFKRIEWKILAPLLIMFIVLVLQFLHPLMITGEISGGQVLTLQKRLFGENVSFGGMDFSYLGYIKQEISLLQAYFTRTALVLSLIYLLSLFFKLTSRKKVELSDSVVLILLIFGSAHPVIFNKYVFIHDFLNMYLLPFIAISASLGLMQLLGMLKFTKVLKLELVILVLVIFFFERLDYTQALFRTNMNQPGLDMANLLNSISVRERDSAVVSHRFLDFYGFTTRFYTKYTSAWETEENLKDPNALSKYSNVIMIDEDIKDKNFYNYLTMKYPYIKRNDISIFSINE